MPDIDMKFDLRLSLSDIFKPGTSMLLSFGAKNFFCFREWSEISLAFNSKVPIDISKGEPASKALCLKGANASGKTNGLKIISFLSYFCTESFNLKPEDEIPFESHFGSTKPTQIFAVFLIDSTEYTYEVSLTKTRVISEKLFRKDARKTLVLNRSATSIKASGIPKSIEKITLRKNASIISTANQYENKALSQLYKFFDSVESNINKDGLANHSMPTFTHAAMVYKEEETYLEFAKKYLNKFDTGIQDIKINKYVNDKKEDIYYPVFINDPEDPKKNLPYQSQSSGTKSLYINLIFYKKALDSGGVLVFDEFDLNLHPAILPELIELFENEETNPKKAQFIFTTHNSDILDLLGKYRTYLFNKEDSECFCYRLDEIPGGLIRNDRSIQSLYVSGKIGGVPKISTAQ